MNTDNLKQIVTVAETGSFSEAASRLGITQPAISLTVKKMEKELDVRIFDRSSGKYRLTDEGNVVVEHASKMLKLEEKMRDSLELARERISGKLRIASSNIPGEYILPLIIGEFKERSPELEIQVEVTDSRCVLEEVASGKAEVGFTGSKRGGGDLAAFPFCPDTLVIVAPRSHPLAGKRNIEPKRLLEEKFVIREEGSGTRELMLAALRRHGISLDRLEIAIELGSTSAVLSAVESGAGITMASVWAAGKLVSEKRITRLKVKGLEPRRSFFLVCPGRKNLSIAGAALLEFVKGKSELLATRERALLGML